MSKERPVCLGVVTGAFGVKGEVRIKSFTEPPENIAEYGDLTTDPGDETLRIDQLRPIKNGLAAKVEGIEDRDAAERLKGAKLNAPRSALPETEEEEEFYYVDLVGCRAASESGEELGPVTAVHDFGAGALIEVGGTPYRFTKDEVPVVDLDNNRLVIADDAVAAKDEER